MAKIQRILVAVKSPGERWSPAVAKATQIARATGAHLELFHGVDARLYVEALDTYECGIADRHVRCGHPADALTRGVRELGADILVLGCISRTGVRRLLIGNTAEQLIYRVQCDLLMVKPPGFVNDIERERRGPRLIATPVCN